MEVMKTEMSGADDRVIATRAIDTDWNAVAPANIVKLVNTCADGLGTSKEDNYPRGQLPPRTITPPRNTITPRTITPREFATL